MIQEVEQTQPQPRDPERWNSQDEAKLRRTLLALKRVAARYHSLTGRSLKVADEVGRCVAAEILGLTLVPDGYAGYDALRGTERIQIVIRPYPSGTRIACPRSDAPLDSVALVVLDDKTLNAREIWEVSCDCLNDIHPRFRIVGLPVHQFKKIGKQVWKSAGPAYKRKCGEP